MKLEDENGTCLEFNDLKPPIVEYSHPSMNKFELGTSKVMNKDFSSPELYNPHPSEESPSKLQTISESLCSPTSTDSDSVKLEENPLSSGMQPLIKEEESWKNFDVETLLSNSETILVKIIKRATSIQAFRGMPISDQLILFSENWAPIFLLHATFAAQYCESIFGMVSCQSDFDFLNIQNANKSL